MKIINILFLLLISINAFGIAQNTILESEAILAETGETKKVKDLFVDDLAVFVAFGSECPILRNHIPNLHSLIQKYEASNIRFIFLDGVKSETPTQILEFKKHYKINFPIYLIKSSDVLKELGLKVLSQVAVYSIKKNKILYSGAINNQFSFDLNREKATENYLINALDAILKGKVVKQPTSRIFGCFITY
jgi:hypothetical protein